MFQHQAQTTIADVDVGASLRVDWKPISHFGLTVGYDLLYLKVDSVASRDLTGSSRRMVRQWGSGCIFEAFAEPEL